MTLLRKSAALLLAGCVASCGSPSEIHSGGGDPTPERLELVSEWGCLDCTGPALLTPFFISLAPDGTLYELDWYEPFVRVFDREGALLLTFGEKGEGPGELGLSVPGEYVPGFAVWADEDGSILVLEPLPPAFSKFSAEGEYLEGLSLEAPDGMPMNFAYDAGRRSFLLVTGFPRDLAVNRFDLAGPIPAEAAPLLTDPDILPRRPDEPTRPVRNFAFVATPDGGFLVGDAWRYEIQVFDAAGQLTGTFGRDIERPRLSDEEIEEARQRAQAQGQPDPPGAPEKPHFGYRSFRYDDNGNLWVAKLRGSATTTVFDVFSSDGEFLTEITMDAELKDQIGRGEAYGAFDVSGGHLAAITVHESGSDQIKVWRVVYSGQEQ